MKTTTETTPAIFLTDYASYNNGTQFEFGHWVQLNDFADADELGEYITNHFKEADEKSPLDEFGSIREEVMITDFEGFPKNFYSESSMDFELLYGYLEFVEGLEEYEAEAFPLFCNHFGYRLDYFEDAKSRFDDAYNGQWNDERDFADHLFDELYLHDVPKHIQYYIDYDKFSNDIFMGDYVFIDGHVFNCGL